MFALILQNGSHLARRSDASALPGCGCFVAIAVIAIVVFLVVKKSRQNQSATAQQPPMAPRPSAGQGPIGSHTFACPWPKCPNCAASAEKMRQQWDGLRKVTWTCGYCGAVQVQDLRDDELPPSARQRLGLDPSTDPNQAVYQQGNPGMGGMGGGVGGLLTGMMIGNMMGGGHHDRHDDDNWRNGGDSGSDSGWGDSGGDSGGDGGWGDSGGDDFGGGDSGGDWS